MIIYLAGSGGPWTYSLTNLLRPEKEPVTDRKKDIPSDVRKLNILESFYYVEDLITSLIPHLQNFMLDSGAFTFRMDPKRKEADWEDYITRYIEYVKKNKVKLYFEMDIDNVIGYDRVAL